MGCQGREATTSKPTFKLLETIIHGKKLYMVFWIDNDRKCEQKVISSNIGLDNIMYYYMLNNLALRNFGNVLGIINIFFEKWNFDSNVFCENQAQNYSQRLTAPIVSTWYHGCCTCVASKKASAKYFFNNLII
jgi:hypothetical protein